MHDSTQWFWLYSPEKQQLAIQTDEPEPYTLPYKSQQLVNISFTKQPLDIEDASSYQSFLELLQTYPAESLKASPEKIAVNAVAFKRFGCPQMPQSWHFQKSDLEQWSRDRTLCELNSGFDQGLFLILDIDDEFASCLLMDPSMQVSAIKTLKQFQVMKVLNNRLLPATIDLAASAQKDWTQKLA